MKDVVSRCPIEQVMRVLSGRWPTLLLYYLKDGTKRFSDLRRDNPTVSHRILSLELRKLYEAIMDDAAEQRGQVRVVDESGEDYLYPKGLFAPVEVPTRTQKLLLQAA